MMRIDGTSGLGPSMPLDRDKVPGNKAGATGAAGKGAAEAGALSARQKQYIQQAGQVDQVNASAVAEAKKLIESGLLETPEAITRLAETIVDRGV